MDIRIGSRSIGEKQPTYIIAEIGLNHQGDVGLAKKLIDASIEAGCDCVKFQKRDLKSLYTKNVLANPETQEHALSYLMEHIVKCELSEDNMRELHAYAREKGVDFMCTPWDEESMKFLDSLGVPAFKVGSPDMTNVPLLRKMATYGKPLLVSTGMSYVSEIWQVIDALKATGVPFVMLHCNSTYPSPYYDIHLNFLKTLQEKTPYPVGYSGHEQGISTSLAAVALGARVLEKHITFDRTLPGPDHKASLLPEEFAELVRQVRIVESTLGDVTRFPSRGEFLNRESLSKSLVARRPLTRGEVLTAEDIDIKSPGKGVSPLRLDHFIGKALVARDLAEGDYLLESDVAADVAQGVVPPDVKRTWGIVARMSDIDELLPCNPRYVEIHLTHGDVHEDVVNEGPYDTDLVIHAPEYDGDNLLDLSSMDGRVRERTVAFMNQTLDHARRVKGIFKNRDQKVKFIVHPGGMSMEKPLLKHIDALNENLLDSLKQLNADGFEVLVENMPPCPWYFGGQWWHASFMDAGEIADFSRRSGYGIVFDTSHAGLFCNFAKKDLEDFAKIILPVTKYLHVSDAAGFNGEGLQIGDGSIDFKRVLPHLVASDLWCLPEIWQGHKFGGEGFITAVQRLKNLNADF